MTVKWNGDKLIRKKNAAIVNGLNFIAKESKIWALGHHPNWQNRTLLAEGSIDVKEFATLKSHKVLWGSVWTNQGANYVWYLEFNHPPFLRAAGDKTYKGLPAAIKRYMKVKK
jgi:hypothetical protein